MDPERVSVPVPKAVRPTALVPTFTPPLVVQVVLLRLLVRLKLPPEASNPRAVPFNKPMVLVAMGVLLSMAASRVETVLVVKAPVVGPTAIAKVPPFTTMLLAVQFAVLPP